MARVGGASAPPVLENPRPGVKPHDVRQILGFSSFAHDPRRKGVRFLPNTDRSEVQSETSDRQEDHLIS